MSKNKNPLNQKFDLIHYITSDVGTKDFLPKARDFKQEKEYKILTEEWIKQFTLNIPNYVHFCGALVFGTQGTGKTTFVDQTALLMKKNYGENLTVLKTKDLRLVTDYLDDLSLEEKDQHVFLTVFDDALLQMMKKEDQKKEIITQLSIIRRYIDQENKREKLKEYGKKMEGLLYFFFNVQLLYFLDKNIRSFLKYRAYKSKSPEKWDIDHYFKPVLGSALFKKLEQIDQMAEKAKNKLKNQTVVDMNGRTGLVIYEDYNEKELEDFRDEIIYLEDHREGDSPQSYIIPITNISDSEIWEVLTALTIQELEKDSETLHKIKKEHNLTKDQDIFHRNIKLVYQDYFTNITKEELVQAIPSISTINSLQTTLRWFKMYLKKDKSLRTIISEKFFKTTLTTVFPPDSVVLHKPSAQDIASLGLQPRTHQPDLLLLRAGQPLSRSSVISFVEVKWLMSKHTFDLEPSWRYSQTLPRPVVGLVLDSREPKSLLRGSVLTTENQQPTSNEWSVNTVVTHSSIEKLGFYLLEELLSEDDLKND